jgi:hypothetical protein
MKLILSELNLLQEVESEPIVKEVNLKSEREPFVFSKKRKLN